MSNWGRGVEGEGNLGVPCTAVLALASFSCRVCLCWVCAAIVRPRVGHRPWFRAVLNPSSETKHFLSACWVQVLHQGTGIER